MAVIPLLVLLACATTEPPVAADCLPTYGDNCGCEPKCMTQGQIDAIEEFCDMSCEDSAGGPSWTCTVVEGQCAVAD